MLDDWDAFAGIISLGILFGGALWGLLLAVRR